MHRFVIFEQDNPQVFSNFGYFGPLSDPSIGLYLNLFRFLDDRLYPILFDLSTVWTFPGIIKIPCRLHFSKSNPITGGERQAHLTRGPVVVNKDVAFLESFLQSVFFLLDLNPEPGSFHRSGCHGSR
ncbi:MAG: hypothetical protein WBG37_11835 [Desulfobacterales bacterium]